MNLHNNKLFVLKVMLLGSIFSFSNPAWALKDDTRQPIDVLSEKQALDLENSRAIFTQNVLITQGSIKFNADKVVAHRPKNASDTLDAYGAPVYFQQTLDDGKVVKGEADKIHYDLSSEFVTLNGHAKLYQQDSQIEGREITYDVKNQQLKANGSSQKRVRTILIPAQLDEKSAKGNNDASVQFNANAPLTQVQGTQTLHQQRQTEQAKSTTKSPQ